MKTGVGVDRGDGAKMRAGVGVDRGDGAKMRAGAGRGVEGKRRDGQVWGHVWTWPIALYLYLGGLGAGITIVSVCLDLLLGLGSAVWLCPLAALVCLGLGSGLLVFELGRPWQFWRVFSRQRAVLTFGAWMVGLLVLVDALYFSCGLAWFPWAGGEWAGGGVLRAAAAILALALGFGVLLYTGIELASMRARVFWNTPALPIVFALGGLLCGCAADYLLVLVSGSPGFVAVGSPGVVAAVLPPDVLSAGVLSPGAQLQLGGAQLAAQLVALPILLIGIAIFGFLTLMALMLYLLLMLTSAGPDARVVAQRWLKGRYALVFWLGLVVMGLAAPLLLAGFALAVAAAPGLELVMVTDGLGLMAAADGLAAGVDSVALAAGGVAALCAICGSVFLRFLVVYSDDRRSIAGEADYWAHLPQGDEPFLKRNWG